MAKKPGFFGYPADRMHFFAQNHMLLFSNLAHEKFDFFVRNPADRMDFNDQNR